MLNIRAMLVVKSAPSESLWGQSKGGQAVWLTTEASFRAGQKGICLADGVTVEEAETLIAAYSVQLGIRISAN